MLRRLQNQWREWATNNLPETHWGFPVSSKEEPSEPSAVSKGVALLIAIMVVAMSMGFAGDMIITSSVAVELATKNRDKVRAEYMAKSGQNLALFVLTIDWGMDLFLAQNMKQPASDGRGDFWNMLNGLPIGGSTLKLLADTQESFGLNAVMDEGVLEQLKLFDGSFIQDVQDETARINVNYCHMGRCTDVQKMLEGLFSCPAEKAFLEKKSIDPKELVARIKDYIDGNSNPETDSGLNDEDEPYLKHQPGYKAKNAPLDSLEELKMIAGWDDEVHAVFSPYLTVYPFQKSGRDNPKINLNTINKELLACIVADDLNRECRQKYELDMHTKIEDKEAISGGKIQDTLKDLLCYSGGKELDKSKWFDEVSRVFRISVKGEVGGQIRSLTLIIKRLDSNEIKKNKTSKKSYEILYWKLI